MLGYAKNSPSELEAYGMKSLADDMTKLLDHLDIPRVILVGHDWGAGLAWRIALYYPDRVQAVACFCTPYNPPTKTYLPIEQVVKRIPSFGYQITFQKEETIELFDSITSEFLNGIYRTYDDQADWVNGDFAKFMQMPHTKLMTDAELKHYVDSFKDNGGFRGPLNWYKTRQINHRDELELLDRLEKGRHITCPVFFQAARNDTALVPAMANNMKKHLPNLNQGIIENSSHWILQEQPDQVNLQLEKWLGTVVLKSTSKL